MKILHTIPFFSEKTAVALGFFDGVHIAHKKVISFAVESGYLPVVFTFSVEGEMPSRKGNFSLLSDEKTKQDLIKKLGIEVLICPPFRDIQKMTAMDFVSEYLIKRLNAKIVVCGENFRFGQNALGDIDLLKNMTKKNDTQIVAMNIMRQEGEIVSSSRIRKALNEADLKTVRSLLGRDYFVNYSVVEGEKNGHKIGYPTINQKFPSNCIVPKRGVYVSKVLVGKKEYLGVSNIGIRPSVSALTKPILETHIVDYCGKNLYGQPVKVAILRYIRPEKKFASIQQLQSQIASDVKFAKKLKDKL